LKNKPQNSNIYDLSTEVEHFYIHQMNRVNSRNGSAMMTAP